MVLMVCVTTVRAYDGRLEHSDGFFAGWALLFEFGYRWWG